MCIVCTTRYNPTTYLYTPGSTTSTGQREGLAAAAAAKEAATAAAAGAATACLPTAPRLALFAVGSLQQLQLCERLQLGQGLQYAQAAQRLLTQAAQRQRQAPQLSAANGMRQHLPRAAACGQYPSVQALDVEGCEALHARQHGPASPDLGLRNGA